MRSKSTFLFLSLFVIIVSAHKSLAQYNPGLAGNFGIDGDLLSGQRLNGTFNGNGTHDWFKKSGSGPNIGLGMIDTTNSSYYASKIASGQNFTFSKGMAFSLYSNQGGYLVLDTRYARDNFGLSSSGGNADSTTYTNGSKNGDNPTIWATTPAGSTVADKCDIIDSYIHMRRDGNTINNTNPSHLILAVGISTLGNTGDRFTDFELFRSRIAYNQITGVFTNSGPASTGGHTAWQFNANGTIKEFGDMTLSFSFNTAGVQDISLYIWVSATDYNSVNAANFQFAANSFYGSAYGYAKIIPKGSNPFNAWGSASTTNITGPVWGTNSKAIGSSPQNYYATSYTPYDFAEAAIDLTSLGIDPALTVGANPCAPPFTRVMAKTRSSASFTSALQDFIGPYTFLDAPQAPAQITPLVLKCNATSGTLSPVTIVPGAVYSWSTNNGNITSNPNATTITVDKGGTYYLNAAITQGCPVNTDSTVVGTDYYQPIATAITVGSINLSDPLSSAQIWGGDVAASNFSTPYGGSVGLDWNWKGPNGYTSSARNNNVTQVGTYTLILTEQRNGCKDTAFTPVTALQTLPVKITAFSAVKKDNDRVLLNWEIADETPQKIELQRSYNGVEFSTITYALAEANQPNQAFNYRDNVSNRTSTRVYYKLKITENSGHVKYSWIINVNYGTSATINFSASPNPAMNYTVLSVTNDNTSNATIQIVDLSGKIIVEKFQRMEKGTNQVMLGEIEKLIKGMYIIRVISEGHVLTQKLLKS